MTPAEIEALVASAQSGDAGAAPVQPIDESAAPAPSAAVPPVERGKADSARGTLGPVRDLSLGVSVEIGRTTMVVQELVRLCRGSIITLDRLAHEPVTVYVGARRLAVGQVVVAGEHFAVRIERVFAGDAVTPPGT